jgi:nucleoid DNA-binding protein
MNKAQLIDEVAGRTGMSKKAVGEVLDGFLDVVTNTLASGEYGGDVALLGFGTFQVNDRPARIGRNPQTGAEVKIEASRAVKFSVGSKLKAAVNQDR